MKRYMRHICVVILTTLSPLTQAQLVTQTIQGVITNATGPLETLIGSGEPVTIEYTFDTSVSDIVPDPGYGRYDGAAISLSISFDDLGLHFENADSLLDVLDDFDPFNTSIKKDGIIIYPGNIISTEIIANMEVELGLFIIEAAAPVNEPLDVTSSDAVPDYPINYSVGHLGFGLTSSVDVTLFEIGTAPYPDPDTIPEEACSGEFKNHGQYVKCIAQDTNASVKDGGMSGRDKGLKQSNAAKSK